MTTTLRLTLDTRHCFIIAIILMLAITPSHTATWSTNSDSQKDISSIPSQNLQNERSPSKTTQDHPCDTEKLYFEKVSGECYRICPVGFFPVQTPPKFCQACNSSIPHCEQCSSRGICKVCHSGYKLNDTLNGCSKKLLVLSSQRKLEQTCPSGEYLLGTMCLSECPDGYYKYFDEVTINRLCVDSCSSFGMLSNDTDYSCARECIDPYFTDKDRNACVKICPSGLFGDLSSKVCMIRCPIGTYGDFMSGLCLNVCPIGTYSSQIEGFCVNQCLAPFFSYDQDRSCVLSCPNGFFGDPTIQKCVLQCTNELYADPTTNLCVPACPLTPALYGDPITRKCVPLCPVGLFGSPVTVTCVPRCVGTFFADLETRMCVTICPTDFFADMATSTCVRKCPAQYYGDTSIMMCVINCGQEMYGDNSTSRCVNMCPVGSYGNNMTRICVGNCPDGSFAMNMTRTCVQSCWGGVFGDNSTNRCVIMCPSNPPYFADFTQSLCLGKCSPGLYAQQISRNCSTRCPIGFYGQNSTWKCVTSCVGQLNSYADNSTGFCVVMCSAGTWGDMISQKCVASCPIGTFGYPETATCVQLCLSPFYGDKLTGLCQLTCPVMFISNQTTRTCESMCSTDMWTNMVSMQCVSSCPAGTFSHAQSLSCIATCPNPYFGDPTTNKCVLNCSSGLYGNPVTMKCVESIGCLPMYAVNATRKCEDFCPQNSWKNFEISRCDACDAKCLNCMGPSSSNCTACNTGSFLNPINECIACTSPCATCVDPFSCTTCLEGYYIVTTNECLACKMNCKTCEYSPTNCTSCSADRVLNASSACECLSGLEDDQGKCATLCTDTGCESCPNDKNVCAQCKASLSVINGVCKCPDNFFLSPATNICTACHQLCSSCSGPLETQCTSCFSTQFRSLNKTSSACSCFVAYYSPNNEATCIQQPMQECPTGFAHDITGQYCNEICGDGKLYNLQCDDGNFDLEDGCDSNCKIQPNFTCTNQKSDEPTICSYKGSIIFELISALKDIYGNIIKLEYRMIPQLKFYQMYPDFKNALKISESVKQTTAREIPLVADSTSSSFNILSALYSSRSKTLLVDVGYTQTATGKTIKIGYIPEATPYSSAMEQSNYEWSIQVSNGLSLIYYPDDVYSQTKTLNTAVMAIYTGTLCLFVLTLAFRKMIGIEMTILIQTQVLSLSMLKELHPSLGVLTEEKYAFGYNEMEKVVGLSMKSGLQNVGLYKAINFEQVFGENVNIMFLIPCLLYIVALIIRLVAIRRPQQSGEKLKKGAIILARQIGFGFVLFSLMNMATSYALQGYAGSVGAFVPEYSGVIKVIAVVIIVGNYIIYGVSFKESSDSLMFYIRNSKTAQLQPLFMTTKAILIAIGIALYPIIGTPIINALMGLSVVFIVFLCVIKPFSNKIDLIRAIIIELSLIYILISRYLLIVSVDLANPGDWKSFLDTGLIAEYGAIATALLISVLSFMLHLFYMNNQISPQSANPENQAQQHKAKGLNDSNIHIYDYYQDTNDSPKKNSSYGKTFRASKGAQFRSSNTLQMINLSDGEGYNSKRKLNGNLAESMEVIQMDE